ncbi:MAG: alpha/beta hydrolase [Eubacterium sp.]|nr:alpha/beta hydrolase [Eubacterium sp.]
MILQTSKVNLYYEKSGTGAPLIMLHGNGEDHTIFNKAITVLKKHFTVYAIDTRGHGKSSPVDELHYEDMAEDIYEFICKLNLKKTIVYGFSDGGIVALILAIKHPEAISRIVASGVNTQPNGLNTLILLIYKIFYFFTRAKRIKLMLNEPNITDTQLNNIKIPVSVTGGSKDMIKQSHLKHIADSIPNSTLTIFNGELHGSYVVNSTKIADFIIETAQK